MKIILIAITLISIVALSSCKKDLEMVQPEKPAQSMSQLKVAGDFDWKTTNEIQLTLKGFVKGIVEVTSSKGVVYQRTFLQQDQPLTIKLTIPAYESSLFLNYLGQKTELKLSSDKLSHEFKIQ
jgi:hypothetical protein